MEPPQPPLPETLQCHACPSTFDPDEVYERFKVDYRARLGWPFTGRRPRWVRQFCSEPCRRVDEAARHAVQNRNSTDRRAAERRAARKAES